MPADRSSSSSISPMSSGEVRKKENGFSSIASVSYSSSSRIRRIVGGHDSRRWSSLYGIVLRVSEDFGVVMVKIFIYTRLEAGLCIC